MCAWGRYVCMTDGERSVPIVEMYADPLTHERCETVTNDALLSSGLHYREPQGNASAQIDDALRSWQALERLEGVLRVEFDPSVECDDEDAALLRSLAYSLLDGRDEVIARPFTQFHIEYDESWDTSELMEHVGKSDLSLSYVRAISANVMGARFDVYEACALVDMTLEKIVYGGDGKGAEFHIADAPGRTFKVLKHFFRSEQEALDGLSALCERNVEQVREG